MIDRGEGFARGDRAKVTRFAVVDLGGVSRAAVCLVSTSAPDVRKESCTPTAKIPFSLWRGRFLGDVTKADHGSAGDKAFMLVTRAGRIIGASPRARIWLNGHFTIKPDAHRLPPPLRNWLLRPEGKRGQCLPLTVRNGDSQLVVTLLHSGADDSFCLMLHRSPAGSPFRRAHSIGLTERQVEVLGGVAAGKSNKEIARALSIEPATIKTHLEQIYVRLGVDNRAAAITRARDLL